MKNFEKSLQKFLHFMNRNVSVLLAAIASLTTQLWHSIDTFVRLEVGGHPAVNYAFGVFFAVSTSFAILLFTVRGKRNLAYFFLLVEVFINLIHYGVIGSNLGFTLVSTIFMCVIVPVTISIYSSSINTDEVIEDTDSYRDSTNANLMTFDYDNPDSRVTVNDIMKPKPKSESGQTRDETLDRFIHGMSTIVQFDISDTENWPEGFDGDKYNALRKLWDNRSSMLSHELAKRARKIVSR